MVTLVTHFLYPPVAVGRTYFVFLLKDIIILWLFAMVQYSYYFIIFVWIRRETTCEISKLFLSFSSFSLVLSSTPERSEGYDDGRRTRRENNQI